MVTTPNQPCKPVRNGVRGHCPKASSSSRTARRATLCGSSGGTRYTRVLDRDVLLVDRFDRPGCVGSGPGQAGERRLGYPGAGGSGPGARGSRPGAGGGSGPGAGDSRKSRRAQSCSFGSAAR